MKWVYRVLATLSGAAIVASFVYAIAYTEPLPFAIAVVSFGDLFGKNLIRCLDGE